METAELVAPPRRMPSLRSVSAARASGAEAHPQRRPPPQTAELVDPDAIPHVHRTVSVKRDSPTKSASTSSGSGSAPPAGRRRQLGHWILGRTVGAGSTGKVKIATHVVTGEQGAVKIISRNSPESASAHDANKEIRTIREIAMCLLLRHPYICAMKDVYTTERHYYMIFEYVDGGQMLDYIISHGKLKEKQARKFSRQISSALAYLHKNSIVHRDLKIENILISKDGNIKIIDFGLSNLYSVNSLLKTFCGSLYFAAPELLNARPYVGPEIDVWSLGIVLYVLVCGRVPFDDQSMQALHRKIKQGHVEYPAWLSHDCRALLSRMLVVDPAARASLNEVMHHPWMVKGYDGAPDTYMPPRTPLTLPLSDRVIAGMAGFRFGSEPEIKQRLEQLVESDAYRQLALLSQQHHKEGSPVNEKRRSILESLWSRRTEQQHYELPTSSPAWHTSTAEGPNAVIHTISVEHFCLDPMISIYYLMKEMQEHEARPPEEARDEPMRIPRVAAPEATYHTRAPFETRQAPARPRARTDGEGEISQAMREISLSRRDTVDRGARAAQPQVQVQPQLQAPTPDLVAPQAAQASQAPQADQAVQTTLVPPPSQASQAPHAAPAPQPHILSPQTPPQPDKKMSLFRRMSSRRARKPPAPAAAPPPVPPPVPRAKEEETLRVPRAKEEETLRVPDETAPPTPVINAPRKSLSIHRRGRDAAGQQPFSTPEANAEIAQQVMLGQAVQPYDVAPSGGRAVTNPVDTGMARSGSTASSTSTTAFATRARSMGHVQGQQSRLMRSGRREQIIHDTMMGSQRQMQPQQKQAAATRPPEAAQPTAKEQPAGVSVRPVFLRGLFSSQTTSTKSPEVIKADLIRVLDELGVQRKEIKGGFLCVHSPSIDVVGSSGGSGVSDDVAGLWRSRSQRNTSRGLTRVSSSDSEHSTGAAVVAGGRDTGVQLGDDEYVESAVMNNMTVKFEAYIVKVSLLQLHGVQFKRISGNSWQYKSLANKILAELKL